MHGQRKNLDSHQNAVDYEPDSSPDNADISQSASRNDLNMQLSPHPNLMSYARVDQDVRMLRGKGTGESSSSSKAKTVVADDGLKMEQGWPYSFRTGPGSSSRSEDLDFEKSRMSFPMTSSAGHCAFMPHAQSNSTQGTNVIPGCLEDNHKHWQALRENVFSNLLDEYKGTTSDPVAPAYLNHFGSSSVNSSYSLEEMDGSGSSTGVWGQSSKRKLHEGSSSQAYHSGTSGSVTQNSNSLSCGRPSDKSFNAINFPLNPLLPIDVSAGNPAQSDVNLLHIDEDASERSLRNFCSARNLRPHEDSATFDSSLDENARSNVPMLEPLSQPRSYSNSVRVRSADVVRPNSRSPQSESEDMYISYSANGFRTLRQSGNSVSRSGDSLTVRNFSPNSGLVSEDEDHDFISTTESRNLGQDPTNWSLATGPDNPAGLSSSSRSINSSNSRRLSPPPPWICQQNPPQIHQRFPGFAPWTLFPSYDTEIRNQSRHSPPPPSLTPGSTPEAQSSRPSSHNVQQANRRLGSRSDRPDDAVIRLPNPFREMAADMEGRRILFSEIRQVLGGVRRGDNMRIEDYMLFDPFIYHGLAEMHDRHRDMRLDVDNMSYEELLALEERIGDVNTGLSEESISKTMKQHKYVQAAAVASPDVEPCCVCQEEFLAGEDMGKLDCGHDFHVHCIKKWLMLKNLCPICKTTGLAT